MSLIQARFLVARLEGCDLEIDAFALRGLLGGHPADDDGNGGEETAFGVIAALGNTLVEFLQQLLGCDRLLEEELAGVVLRLVGHGGERGGLVHHRGFGALAVSDDEHHIVHRHCGDHQHDRQCNDATRQ